MQERVPGAGKEITARITTDKEMAGRMNTQLANVVIEEPFHIVLKRGDIRPCGNEMCNICICERKLRNIFRYIAPQATRVVTQSIGLGIERHVAVLRPEQSWSEIHRHVLERTRGHTLPASARRNDNQRVGG